MFNRIPKEADLLAQLNEALKEITISMQKFFREEAPSSQKNAASSKRNPSSLFTVPSSTNSNQEKLAENPARFGP